MVYALRKLAASSMMGARTNATNTTDLMLSQIAEGRGNFLSNIRAMRSCEYGSSARLGTNAVTGAGFGASITVDETT